MKVLFCQDFKINKKCNKVLCYSNPLHKV